MAETEKPRITGVHSGNMVQSANARRLTQGPNDEVWLCQVHGPATATRVFKQLSVFDTGLGNEIPIDKIAGSRAAEAMRRLVVAPPVRYAYDDG